MPSHTNEPVNLLSKTDSSIEIGWQHLHGISTDLVGFYGYLIRYKAETLNANYIEASIVSYNSEPKWEIENLRINTQYSIEIKPFRKQGTEKEFGTSYEILKVKANCAGK